MENGENEKKTVNMENGENDVEDEKWRKSWRRRENCGERDNCEDFF